MVANKKTGGTGYVAWGHTKTNNKNKKIKYIVIAQMYNASQNDSFAPGTMQSSITKNNPIEVDTVKRDANHPYYVLSEVQENIRKGIGNPEIPGSPDIKCVDRPQGYNLLSRKVSVYFTIIAVKEIKKEGKYYAKPIAYSGYRLKRTGIGMQVKTFSGFSEFSNNDPSNEVLNLYKNHIADAPRFQRDNYVWEK